MTPLTRYLEKLEAENSLGENHGCFTGDCPHDDADECIQALKEYILEKSNELTTLIEIVRVQNEALRMIHGLQSNTQNTWARMSGQALSKIEALITEGRGG